MDNEAIVDEIVRSLSFEVIAVPQNVVQPDSTSQVRPVNVKIRVRKKNDSRLRHGALSMPKVDRKDKIPDRPERIRLVSSDQTIMSFNVVMEGEFDDVSPKQRQQNLNMVIPGSEVCNNEDDYTSLSKNANSPTPIFLKRNKDIFGTCKPGGCLDPPFSEDKYSYQPAKLNMSLPTKDDTAKLRTSSIFKNSLFKRKKKLSQDANIPENNIKSTEADSILSLNESGSQTQQIPLCDTTYSNSIITYPHIPNSSELRLPDEKLIKKRYSSEDKSRSSMTEGNGSYFVIPKKAKNVTNQNDPIKVPEIHVENWDKDIKLTKEKSRLEYIKSSSPTTETDNFKVTSRKPSKSEKDETCGTPLLHNFVPIPLLVKLDDNKNYTTNVECNTYDESMLQTSHEKNELIDNDKFVVTSVRNSGEILDSIEEVVLPAIQILNYTSEPHSPYSSQIKENTTNEEEETNSSTIETLENIDDNVVTLKDALSQENLSDLQINKNLVSSSSPQGKTRSSIHIIQSQHTPLKLTQDTEVEIEQEQLFKNNKNAITVTKPSHDILFESDINYPDPRLQDHKNFLSADVAKYVDQSHSLVPTKNREKSMLDVTADKLLSVQNILYSTEELNEIWENATEPLKSIADVINALSSKRSSENQLYTTTENQILELNDDKSSVVEADTTKTSKEDLKLEDIVQGNKYSNDSYVNAFENKYDKLKPREPQKNISALDSTKRLISPSVIERNETEQENTALITKNEEKLIIIDLNDVEEEKYPTIQDTLTKNSYTCDIIADDLIKSNLQDDINIPDLNNVIELTENLSNIKQEDEDFFMIKKEFLERSSNQSTNSRTKSDPTLFIESNDGVLNVELSEKSSKLDVCDANVKQSAIDSSYVYTKEDSKKSYIESASIGVREGQNIGIDVMKYKNIENRSVPLSLEIENVYYGENPKTSDQNNEIIQNKLLPHQIAAKTDLDIADALNETNKSIAEQTFLALHGVEPEQKTQEIISSYLEESNKISELATILRKQPFWKIDIAVQSYLNEKNERIIKSYNSDNLPERRNNDALLVAQCDIGSESNELKFPIDHENDLCIQIKNNRTRSRSTVILSEKSDTIDELYKKKKFHTDIRDPSVENIYYEDVSKSEADTHTKTITNDIRDALITVYEQELVPLQDIIKGLREEIDMIAAYQLKFREKAQKLTPKRSRPLRLVGNKKCGCVRKN